MAILSYLSFCSSDPCSSPEALPHEHEGRKKPGFMARKTRCSVWRKKKKTKKEMRRHHHHQEPILMADSISTDISLQEWFAKSPSVKNQRIFGNNYNDDGGGGDDNSSKVNNVSFSGKYSSVSLEALLNSSEFDSSSMETTSDSRDLSSLSLEKLLMMRENEDEEKRRKKKKKKKKGEVVEVGFYSLAQSRSVGRERKVSFRLPEASDIIILNSPER